MGLFVVEVLVLVLGLVEGVTEDELVVVVVVLVEGV